MLNKILQDNYDKLLHVSLTFFAFLWLVRITEWGNAGATVLALQVAKTIWNRLDDDAYKPLGDWLANGIGYLFVWLYLGM